MIDFLKKFGCYSFGSVMTLAAGLISFPIFTRMLTPADYGLLSLVNLTGALCITFSKGGLQQALLREWDATRGENRVVVSTALFGSLMITLALCAVCGTAALLLSYARGSFSYLLLFLVTAGVVITETVKSIIYNKIRAMHRALKYNALSISSKYGQIALAVLFMSWFGASAYSVLAGFIAASIVVIVWMLYEERRAISAASFDRSTFKGMLGFGFPLIFYELNTQALNFFDRYLIGYFRGAEAVGIYSAAYNLTFYVQNLLVSTVSLTIYPMIVEVLKKEGYAAARELIRDSLLWFTLVGSAAALGFAALGADIFILTASRKYAEAAPVIAPVICGSFFYGVFTVAASELFVQKSTRSMALMVGVAALGNILLNLVLIPSLGLIGAAYATLACDAFLAALGLWKLGAFAGTCGIPLALQHLVPSLVMYGVLRGMPGHLSWGSVLLRTAAGFSVWLGVALVLNRSARKRLGALLGKVKSVSCGSAT